MSRAIWKGPFVDPSLIKKVDKMKNQTTKTPIKTWSRKSTIIPDFVGYSFLIHNGKKFIPIKISEEMVGHKLGEFSPTRTFSGHTPADKKAAKKLPQLHLQLLQERLNQKWKSLKKELAMAKNENIVKAINRNVRSSPRKINLLLKDIRGKKADIVIRDLSFARKRIAFDIKKTVEAAIANAENNFQYDIDNLYVKEAYVGKSIVLKRFRARAKGRASGIKKPYSNVTIILSEKINKKEEIHGTKS